jgi:hypothetical protein
MKPISLGSVANSFGLRQLNNGDITGRAFDISLCAHPSAPCPGKQDTDSRYKSA